MAKDELKDPITERLAELDRLIEQQKARLASMSGGITEEGLQRIVGTITESQRQIAEAARPTRHSNPDHLHISAFSYPEGDLKREKPKFRAGANGRPREVFFNNHREREEDLTPAEIDAYNLITKSCEARDGRWTATVKQNAVFVTVPSHTQDARMDLPNGLVLILRELADGPKAVDLVDLVAEVAELRKQMAARDGLVVAT